MPTSMHEILLNPEYAPFFKGGPEWATAITRSGAGGAIAHRNQNREDYVSRYEVNYALLTDPLRDQLRSFAILRHGMANAFRFLATDKFFLDNELVGRLNATTGEVERLNPATGTNGTDTNFYLVQYYEDIANQYTRRIIKPSPYNEFFIIIAPASAPDDVTMISLTPGSGLSGLPLYGTANYGDEVEDGSVQMDYTTGVITFSHAPASGLLIKATGVFHLPVCFTEDWHKMTIDVQSVSDSTISVEEVLPVELGIV